MEYTKSVDKNGEVFEVFTGTPEEIAKLIKLKSTHINYIEFEQQMEKVRKLAKNDGRPTRKELSEQETLEMIKSGKGLPRL